MHRRASIAALLLVGVSAGVALAQFMESAPVTGNTFATKADWAAPVVSSSVIAKTVGYTPGYIKQGGTYYVYVNVADSGNPPSGINTVTANVSSITTGQTAAALSSGSFSSGGVSYNYRTASLTANAPLAEGTYSYTIATSDVAGNAGTTTGMSVVVDNTAPSASDIQTTNAVGGTNGVAELGDSITYTFSDPMEPNSFVSGWTGASTNVVLRLNHGGLFGNDTVTIFDATNATQLPFGTVNLGRTDYTSSNRTFGASGTPSTMVMSGSTITITLGTASGGVSTASGTGNMSWTPSSTATDRAANACTTTARTETGTADKDF